MNENIRARLEMQMSGIAHNSGALPMEPETVMGIILDEQRIVAEYIERYMNE